MGGLTVMLIATVVMMAVMCGGMLVGLGSVLRRRRSRSGGR
jgi:hypothetical protein